MNRIAYLIEELLRLQGRFHFVGSIEPTHKTIMVWCVLAYGRTGRKMATGIGSIFYYLIHVRPDRI